METAGGRSIRKAALRLKRERSRGKWEIVSGWGGSLCCYLILQSFRPQFLADPFHSPADYAGIESLRWSFGIRDCVEI
jgi:hypothetical protein